MARVIHCRSSVRGSPLAGAGALAAVVLLAGCASSGGSDLGVGSSTGLTRIDAAGGRYDLVLTKDKTASRSTIEGAPAAVWAALPGAYQALGLQGAVVDPTARIYGIPRHRALPRQIAGQRLGRLFTCGSGVTGSSADRDQLYLLLLSQVDSTAQGTALLTRVDVYARPRARAGNPVDCGSNGRLEILLVDSLKARLARASIPPG